MYEHKIEVSKLQPAYAQQIILSFSHLAKLHYDAFALSLITKIKESKADYLQSGDDSSYNNLWEEYCSQIQDEQGFGFEMVQDYIKNLILSTLTKLQQEEPHIFQAIDLYHNAILLGLIKSSIDYEVNDIISTPEELADMFFGYINEVAMEYPLNAPFKIDSDHLGRPIFIKF